MHLWRVGNGRCLQVPSRCVAGDNWLLLSAQVIDVIMKTAAQTYKEWLSYVSERACRS